ncbi:MAG: glycosyltransferase family 39 protein [Candidatus Levybacteria bacterium]|nr:glycosyltransferase family 39 protein [Candidatus Levybacteria bacterium]
MKNEKLRKFLPYSFLCAIFFLIIVFQPVSVLFKESETFFSRGYGEQYEDFKRAYSTSQYVQKEEPGVIPDQTLESFAGGAFLRGINPISIIHDQPPMGRYIISLSILLFDNTNTIMALLYFLSGLGVFLIARLVLKNTLLSFIPLAIFINEPLFINKFYNTPLLEPIQLPFIIFSLYFFILGATSKKYLKWFILTSIMLGFVISIRFFALGAFLILVMILYFIIKRQFNKRFFTFILTLPVSLVVLLISYTRTMQLGSSILNIFAIQKYIYTYHKAQLTLPFSFWDLILFNRWHTWWGAREILSDSQWIILWPISMISALAFTLLGILKKLVISDEEKIIIIWILIYSVFLSLGDTSTRYFAPVLPFIYIVSTSFLKKAYEKIYR